MPTIDSRKTALKSQSVLREQNAIQTGIAMLTVNSSSHLSTSNTQKGSQVPSNTNADIFNDVRKKIIGSTIRQVNDATQFKSQNKRPLQKPLRELNVTPIMQKKGKYL
jgi:hypothetical protein